MTISTTANKVTYNGDGTTTIFIVPFAFLEDSHLVVVRINAIGTRTTLTLSTDYTVSGAGEEDGGRITCVAAPADGYQLEITRTVPYTQETAFRTQGTFSPVLHEKALDKLTMEVQQLDTVVDEAVDDIDELAEDLREEMDAITDRIDAMNTTPLENAYEPIVTETYSLQTDEDYDDRIFTKVYHVDPSGSDSDTGTSEDPFLTINKATLVAQPGEAIYVHAGTYYEQVLAQRSGTEDARITIFGQRGPNGEYLTVVNSTTDVATYLSDIGKAWVSVSDGIYKADFGVYKPGSMILGGQTIARICEEMMADSADYLYPLVPGGTEYGGLDWMALPDPQDVRGTLDTAINIWDVAYAMYGYKASDGFTYMRFRDGSSPASHSLRFSKILVASGAWQYCFDLQGCSYITLKDISMVGGTAAVRLANSQYCIIEDCKIRGGRVRVYQDSTPEEDGSIGCIVRRNDIALDFYGYNGFGAWGDTGAPTVELAKKEYMYLLHKYHIGADNTADIGIRWAYSKNGEIYDNDIHHCCEGVFYYTTENIAVHDNKFRHLSDLGVCDSRAEQDDWPLQAHGASIYGNRFHDCEQGIRFNGCDDGIDGAQNIINVYRNTFWNPSKAGIHIYFHYQHDGGVGDPESQVETFFPRIYHNSFGAGALPLKTTWFSADRGFMPNLDIRNNIFDSTDLIDFGGRGADWIAHADHLGNFDYNWVGPQEAATPPDWAWWGSHNIWHSGGYLWPPDKEPTWVLPDVCDARQAGQDLTGLFPGFDENYWSGWAPDMGALIEKAGIGAEFDRLWFRDRTKYLEGTDDGKLALRGWNGFVLDFTDTSASPGDAACHTPCGLSAIATGASSVTVYNTLATASSLVRAWIQQAAADTTLLYLTTYADDGRIVITGNAAATADVTVGWEILN